MAELADSSLGPVIESPADALVEEAWEAAPADRRRLALEAVALDPDCLDAHSLLAALSDDPEPHLRRAVEIGERLWSPLFDEPLMDWSGMAGPRPWMRAMRDLAELVPPEEAARLRDLLLRLDPADRFGASLIGQGGEDAV